MRDMVMNYQWKTYGHEAVKELVEKQLEKKVFSHSYLFVGPKGVGKRKLAMEFSGQILGTPEASRHVDFSFLESDDAIKVEEIRTFIGNLYGKPFAGTYKVAIVDGIENLTNESSNALLKTLEEPSPSTIIILISQSKNILPTVLSRCQIFNFNAFTSPQLLEYGRTRGESITEEMAIAAQGSIGALNAFLENPKSLEELRGMLEKFRELERLTLAERFTHIKHYAEHEPEELEKIFRNWIAWKKESIKSGSNVLKSLVALQQAVWDLRTNKNKQLILQHLFRCL